MSLLKVQGEGPATSVFILKEGSESSLSIPPNQPGLIAEIGRRFLVSLLLLGLFGEWLYPLHTYLGGDSSRIIGLFLGLTGAILLAGCIRLPSVVYGVFPPLLIMGSLLFLYGSEEGLSWFSGYFRLISADIMEAVQSGRLYGFSGETRMLLLLIGWTLLVISVQMLALSRHSIMLFLSITVLYLLAMEIVLQVSVYPGLVRTAGWGLILQLTVFRNDLRTGGQPVGTRTQSIISSAAAAFCVLSALLLSSLLPVQPERNIPWDQVVEAMEGWSGAGLSGDRGEGYVTSGYGRDDTQLGAPLHLRHELYFTAVSPQRTYWRGESKSLYTGRGWASSPSVEREGVASVTSGMEAPANEEASSGIKQTVIFKQPVTGKIPFFSGGSIVQLERIFAGKENGTWSQLDMEQVNARYDADADAFFMERAFPAQEIYGYELITRVPEVTAEQLRQVNGADPVEIMNRDTQLPDTVPERVRLLGASLVEEQANRYDAVTAVMNYLKEHYLYSLETTSPPAGSDFTDFFLFEQKIGYCDHFSTAMTVLLRSGGIPARWVKGFAPGTPVPGDNYRYDVSYADAHAWVEVYFPGIGWIPFDPTPGYDMAFAPTSDALASLDHTASPMRRMWRELQHSITRLLAEGGAMVSKSWNAIRQDLFGWTGIVLFAGFLIITAAQYQKVWLRHASFYVRMIVLQRYKRFPDTNVLLGAADQVWRELHQSYGPNTQGMTAREYIAWIQEHCNGPNENWDVFIRDWETLFYGGERMDRTKSRLFLKLCRNLAFHRH